MKTPKIYFRDSGLPHRLAGINDIAPLQTWPKLGASWDGFALEEILRAKNVSGEEACFRSVHSRGELDLLVVKDGRRPGFEFKSADSPRMTPAWHMALEQWKFDRLALVCPGEVSFELAENVSVRGLNRVLHEPNS